MDIPYPASPIQRTLHRKTAGKGGTHRVACIVISGDDVGWQVQWCDERFEPRVAFGTAVIAQITTDQQRINRPDLVADAVGPGNQPRQSVACVEPTRHQRAFGHNMRVGEL